MLAIRYDYISQMYIKYVKSTPIYEINDNTYTHSKSSTQGPGFDPQYHKKCFPYF
jgi:hypothetical protein